MAGVTGKDQIDFAIERFLAESRYTLQERKGVVRSLIRNEILPENEGPSVYIPKYGTVNTYALTEGVDMTQAQQITDTGMTITPAEFGAQVVLTDMMLMTVRDEFFNVATRILADSFDRQQDQTLCDDFDSYSLALGSPGTALNVGHILAAEASIKYNAPANGTAGRGGEPGPGSVRVVITPSQAHSLKKTMAGGIGASGNTQIVPALDRTGHSEHFMVGTVDVYTDININKDTSDDAKGGAFVEDAQVFVQLGPAANAERERDASLRGWEINFVGRWARGEYDDDWGREMLFDSALPTS